MLIFCFQEGHFEVDVSDLSTWVHAPRKINLLLASNLAPKSPKDCNNITTWRELKVLQECTCTPCSGSSVVLRHRILNTLVSLVTEWLILVALICRDQRWTEVDWWMGVLPGHHAPAVGLEASWQGSEAAYQSTLTAHWSFHPPGDCKKWIMWCEGWSQNGHDCSRRCRTSR